MAARPADGARRLAASERLHRTIAFSLPALMDVGDRFVTHRSVRELYPEFLFTSHCILRASVPLMEAARERALAGRDPASKPLAAYFEKHIPEELDHDEWLLRDLEVLGRDRSAVLARPPSPTIAALVGAQYYWILHFDPVALLGYMGLLEGYPPSPAVVDELIAATGYPEDAFRTLREHAELDPDHADELDELLDGLPLAPEASAVIGLSAMYSADMYTKAIEEILEEAA